MRILKYSPSPLVLITITLDLKRTVHKVLEASELLFTGEKKKNSNNRLSMLSTF